MSKKTSMTIRAASRIYSSTSRKLGSIPKSSFATRAMKAATTSSNKVKITR